MERTRLLLYPPQGQARGEHRKETISVSEHGGPVGEGDEPEGEKFVQPDGFPMTGPQIDHQPADERAAGAADQ